MGICNGIQIQTKTTTNKCQMRRISYTNKVSYFYNHSYRILFHTLLLSNSATVQCAPLFYIAVLYQRHSLFFYFLSCLVGCLLHEDLSSKRHLDMHTNLPSRIEPWSQYSALVAQYQQRNEFNLAEKLLKLFFLSGVWHVP